MRTIAIAACLLVFATAAMAAEEATKASKTPAADAPTKASKAPDANAPTKASKAPDANATTKASKAPDASAAKKAARAPPAPKAPPLEKLTCRTGPNDEQVRLIVEAVKGRAMEFAFYSRLGTRVCSIHGRRGDGSTKWEDAEGESGKANIKLFTGKAALEYVPGRVKMTFSDVDRMHYCGMYGELNGSVEVILKKPECGVQGLFEGSGNEEKKEAAPGD